MERLINSTADLPAAAKFVLERAADETVFLFFGAMGAGKTTLIKAICDELGIREGVSSPTFSIVNEYPSPAGPVYHFDLYRLKNEAEAFDIGMEDYLDSGNYCFIEWPEKLGTFLPQRYLRVELTAAGNEVRKLELALVST